ncbi:MAG: NACHT domain-containing protein, partial [Chthoniobacteraceae bacterium]|nr:NACHT domain-containing protein [Chthoniobacteraceae bacterium]
MGNGGCGKSALIARAAQDLLGQTEHSQLLIMQRYIGGVSGTESLLNTLSELCVDLAFLNGYKQQESIQNKRDIRKILYKLLEGASAQRPVCLFLDSLDQLEQADEAWTLEWLPKELPPFSRLVVSVRSGTVAEASARIRFPGNIVEVYPLNLTEGKAILSAWMADKQCLHFSAGLPRVRGRRLTPDQEEAVLSRFSQSGSALWLKLAYEDASTWASWDPPRELPESIQDLIDDLFDTRLLKRQKHPRIFTHRAIAYLSAGRFGLSEDELGRVLGSDPDVRREFEGNQRTQKKWDNSEKLPPILWSRLRSDLESYLGELQMDGSVLMRWFHREFTDSFSARFLSSTVERHTIHGALASTFQKMERDLRPLEMNDDGLFRATDSGGKPVSAALRRLMEQPWHLWQSGAGAESHALVTDFGFCMGKCAANRAEDLLRDFIRSRGASENTSATESWSRIFFKKGRLLRRGDTKWPAHKILLQIAMEDADLSPLRYAAQTWLSKGLCD